MLSLCRIAVLHSGICTYISIWFLMNNRYDAELGKKCFRLRVEFSFRIERWISTYLSMARLKFCKKKKSTISRDVALREPAGHVRVKVLLALGQHLINNRIQKIPEWMWRYFTCSSVRSSAEISRSVPLMMSESEEILLVSSSSLFFTVMTFFSSSSFSADRRASSSSRRNWWSLRKCCLIRFSIRWAWL